MTGLLLLIVAAVATLALPGVLGHRLAGAAMAAVIPPPPAIGACVTSVSERAEIRPDARADQRVAYPTAVLGSCAGAIAGEVMSVDLAEHRLDRATITTYQADSSKCQLAEVNYVGSIGPFDPDRLTEPSIAWEAPVSIESISVGPSDFQRAAGQTWTACVGTGDAGTTYRGRIAQALRTGVLPSTFATCWRTLLSSTETQDNEQHSPCTTPHSVELLGTTSINDPAATIAQIQKSCRGMASRALRTPDPTRGGRLEISAYSLDGSSVLPLEAADLFTGHLGCVASIAPPERLAGTLIGIENRPLPLSG